MEIRDDTHEPVMFGRIVELLPPVLASSGAVYVNCTLGLGGHAQVALEVAPSARFIGIDHDPDALAMARGRLGPPARRTTLVKAVYGELLEVLADLGVGGVRAMFTDLGFSSLQIDHEERGFAYRVDAPLDVCMSRRGGRSAADLLNSVPPVELVRILRHYGEEKFVERIVATVVEERETRLFRSSGQLVEVISSVTPAAAGHSPGYLTKRAFQTLRIAVNDELVILERFLSIATTALTLGGRLVVFSYHSPEDGPVKQYLVTLATDGVPRDMPAVPKRLEPHFKLLTRGAERPPEQEI